MSNLNDFQSSELINYEAYEDTSALAPLPKHPNEGSDKREDEWRKISQTLLRSFKKQETEEGKTERLFQKLSKRVFDEFGPSSDIEKLYSSHSHLEVVGLGQGAVPLLLRDMSAKRRPWFVALAAITRANPAKSVEPGDINGLINAWLAWGRRHKFL